MAIGAFGHVGNDAIGEVVLRNRAGVELRLLSWGATVRSLKVPVGGGLREITLGFETMEGYLANRGHFGALAGRVANRIAGASFTLDGVEHRLTPNFLGKHTLHGGGAPYAFGERNWRIVAHDGASATLALTSPDGDGGFPGTLETVAKIGLAETATVVFDIEARTDKATLVNIAQHSYFNLAGGGDVLGHLLQVEADFHTPTDAENVTTGEVRAVEGTPFDFRTARPIRFGDPHRGYDGNFALRGQPGVLRRAATLSVPDLALDLWTTEPGVQIYDAPRMKIKAQGLGWRDYGPCGGFCMECQHFADAPNKPHFPSIVLRPGAVYRQRTEWRLR